MIWQAMCRNLSANGQSPSARTDRKGCDVAKNPKDRIYDLAMSLEAGQVFAGYTIIRPLGSGGMGQVYLAAHPRLPREDALKVLPPELTADAEFRARFVREADLAAGLSHPHIVRVHDRREEDGHFWMLGRAALGRGIAWLRWAPITPMVSPV